MAVITPRIAELLADLDKLDAAGDYVRIVSIINGKQGVGEAMTAADAKISLTTSVQLAEEYGATYAFYVRRDDAATLRALIENPPVRVERAA